MLPSPTDKEWEEIGLGKPVGMDSFPHISFFVPAFLPSPMIFLGDFSHTRLKKNQEKVVVIVLCSSYLALPLVLLGISKTSERK